MSGTTTMSTDYQPIACGFYDIFEIAIMRAQRLELRWRDADGTEREGRVTPLDLATRDGAEFLAALDPAGQRFELRLDAIIAAQAAP
ncbi:MAG: hypothetical protein ACFCUG_05940 [Thiotrichales bacterium]